MTWLGIFLIAAAIVALAMMVYGFFHPPTRWK